MLRLIVLATGPLRGPWANTLKVVASTSNHLKMVQQLWGQTFVLGDGVVHLRINVFGALYSIQCILFSN